MKSVERSVQALSIVGVIGLAASCRDDDVATEEACYLPEPQHEEPPYRLPYCKWGTDVPEGPPGTAAYRSGISVPVEANRPCNPDPCDDAEEIDALIREKIATQCCEPIEGFLRGCWERRTRTDGTQECHYGAYYFSKCTEPATSEECTQQADSG